MDSDHDPSKRGVAPFGHLGIKACSRLPQDFRSVPRPSSPPSAKASTRCPSLAQSQNSRQSSVIRRQISDHYKASHRTHPTVIDRQSPVVREEKTNKRPAPPNGSITHTHFRIFERSSVVSRRSSDEREKSPSNGLRLPSCPDRPKTRQNLIHNQQRTYQWPMARGQ